MKAGRIGKHLYHVLREACFHAKGSHQKVKNWLVNQLFVPVRHQITHVPAIGCLLWLCVDISSLGGKPELISHKGWFNNNQTLEANRKEHNDPTQPQEKWTIRAHNVCTANWGGPWGCLRFLNFYSKNSPSRCPSWLSPNAPVQASTDAYHSPTTLTLPLEWKPGHL